MLSILLTVCFMLFLLDGMWGVRDGWNSASLDQEEKSEVEMHRVEVNLEPLVNYSFPDTLHLVSGKQIPYESSTVSMKLEESNAYTIASMTVVFILTPLLLALIIWGGVSFIRFILDVQKGKIFIPLNVRRLWVICWLLVVIAVLQNVTSGLDYFLLVKDSGITVPGYRIANFHFQHETFFIALFFALFAEIFALGVKLKEEQELTI